jgi:hypothetical protein
MEIPFRAAYEKVLLLIAVGVRADRVARAALKAVAKLERVGLRFALGAPMG